MVPVAPTVAAAAAAMVALAQDVPCLLWLGGLHAVRTYQVHHAKTYVRRPQAQAELELQACNVDG